MPSRWNVVAVDPVTGKVGAAVASGRTATQVIQFLQTETGFDADKMAAFAVGDADTIRRYVGAERWMESHAVEHVIAAWNAGARATRQEKLREWWPALALALDNLEANLDAQA